jgi:hypothetical protein
MRKSQHAVEMVWQKDAGVDLKWLFASNELDGPSQCDAGGFFAKPFISVVRYDSKKADVSGLPWASVIWHSCPLLELLSLICLYTSIRFVVTGFSLLFFLKGADA